MSRRSRFPLSASIAMVLLLAAVVGLQIVRERAHPRTLRAAGGDLLYVQSPAVVTRAALSYRSLLADVYWIRALQHYGRTALFTTGEKRYELLFPFLDLTTSLDPRFNIAYRFGSIFLTEPPPAGPGRPDLAIVLLKKGLEAQPQRWEYAQDIGFVYYRARKYADAADWFQRASTIPGAPSWMAPLEATTRTRGGDRQTARRLWSEVVKDAGAEEMWLRREGQRRLAQLDALDQIDELERRVRLYAQSAGRPPQAWLDLGRAGYLRSVPLDPLEYPYQLDPGSGRVTLDPKSPLNPLPVGDDMVF
jgi:tetratricopeptide (TPR) repeat protein